MSVHKDISKLVNEQHDCIMHFKQLDLLRESAIEEAIHAYRETGSCNVNRINEITKEINGLAHKGIVPTRKLVTVEMIQEFIDRKYGK